MTRAKKPEPNPIEKAIGDRAKDPKAHEKFTKEYQAEPIPQNPSEIPNEPSPQEMQTLEELNRQTEEKLLNNDSEEIPMTTVTHPIPKVPIIPVSTEDPPPAIETSSQESQPPQKIDNPLDNHKFGTEKLAEYLEREGGIAPTVANVREATSKMPEFSVEDKELVALRDYILSNGFVVSGVAMHIVMLCSQPLVTPSTTSWDFADRAKIPDMVLAILRTPGYLEGIWSSLKIVMGTNIGNAAWTAGISTTIAFFDCIRGLPILKELKNDS